MGFLERELEVLDGPTCFGRPLDSLQRTFQRHGRTDRKIWDPNPGPEVFPRVSECLPSSHRRASEHPQTLKKWCSRLGESMIFKIEAKTSKKQKEKK